MTGKFDEAAADPPFGAGGSGSAPNPTKVLKEILHGRVNLCGSELVVERARQVPGPFYPTDIDFSRVRSAFAVALHMQQPLIPEGGPSLETSPLVSNLQFMMENQHLGDNHNAPVFRDCYRRMAEFVPRLEAEGKRPRVMLDYSGTLLYGLRKMGLDDVLESLRRIACHPAVEWLGSTWGHAVAPSTPVVDFRLHVKAWQHHFAALYGLEALARVRGFSPAEMALPNHPDVAFEFVRTLRDCGYRWVLVQEHTVEEPGTGRGPSFPHRPHRLVCTDSRGRTASIVALVKTQGSDTKLVAQMQPYYEARGLSPIELGGRTVPPLVVQIADGENGGVMMNEFPPKYFEVVRECSGSETPIVLASEYLEALGLAEEDLPELQPLHQNRIWERMEPGEGPERLSRVLDELLAEDDRFHVEGGSWTNDLSWVRGYEDVLRPLEEVSAMFHQRTAGISTDDPRYRNALFHLLTSQASCYRYWGQGRFTEYAREICRRTRDILVHDLAQGVGNPPV